jgi:hypothetical protein
MSKPIGVAAATRCGGLKSVGVGSYLGYYYAATAEIYAAAQEESTCYTLTIQSWRTTSNVTYSAHTKTRWSNDYPWNAPISNPVAKTTVIALRAAPVVARVTAVSPISRGIQALPKEVRVWSNDLSGHSYGGSCPHIQNLVRGTRRSSYRHSTRPGYRSRRLTCLCHRGKSQREHANAQAKSTPASHKFPFAKPRQSMISPCLRNATAPLTSRAWPVHCARLTGRRASPPPADGNLVSSGRAPSALAGPHTIGRCCHR